MISTRQCDLEAAADLYLERLIVERYENFRLFRHIPLMFIIDRELSFGIADAQRAIRTMCQKYEPELIEMGYVVSKENEFPVLNISDDYVWMSAKDY